MRALFYLDRIYKVSHCFTTAYIPDKSHDKRVESFFPNAYFTNDLIRRELVDLSELDGLQI